MEQPTTNNPTSTRPFSLALKIAVIDKNGKVLTTNRAWAQLVKKRGNPNLCAVDIGDNYLSVCRKMASSGNGHAQRIIGGMESVISRKQDEFYLEYPCIIGNEEHWFAMTIKPLGYSKSQTTIIQEDITEKKRFQYYLNSIKVHQDRRDVASERLGSFELNLVDNTTQWSDEHYRIFGLEPQSEKMTYERFMELVHPAYLGKVNHSMEQLIRHRKEVELYFGIKLSDGALKYVYGKAWPSKESEGNVTRISGTVQELTEDFGKEISIKDETLHHSHTAIAMSDLRGIITYANPAFVRLWGFASESEILGLSNGELGGSREKITEIMDAVRKSGSWYGKDRAKKKDGTLFDIYLTANLVKDSRGRPLCVTASFIDITEQEKAKKELLDTGAKAEILFDYSPIIIWEEDFSEVKDFVDQLREKGVNDFRRYFEAAPCEVKRLASLVRVTQANQMSLDFYGASSLEELRTNLPNRFLDDSWDVFKEELIALAEGQWQFDSEIRVKTAHGDIKHLSMCLAVPPQFIDSLKTVLVSFVDITKIKENERVLKEKERQIKEYASQLEEKVAQRTKELRFSEAKLIEANKLAKIGHWSLDDSQEGVKWSEGLYEIYGLEKNTPISKEVFFEKIRFEDPEDISRRIEAINRGESMGDIEYGIIDAKGNEKYIRSIHRPPIDNGNGKGKTQFGVIQDITRQKSVENQLVNALKKEQELNELKSHFVSMASHEFRTPLAAILSSLNLIGKYKDIGALDKQEKHIQRIKKSVSNMATLLDDFLSLEKMESGKTRTNPMELNLTEYIEDILLEVQPWQKEGQRVVHMHTGHTGVNIDPHLTKNVLLNLLSNALKYSPQESTVYLSTQNHGEKLTIQVKDEGMGIPEKEQKNLFSRFFRASNAHQIGGTGLGLTIVKLYLELMGGEIDFASEEGKGTTFKVMIPVIANI
ncbi:PAS domain-containing sensor histidine kinase [Poritiphilus flavus]|uniref:histidine kinase n=1 Tax=Poritiphilus flavus TaxID=2697053 RepID=A0A6L9EG25_9FLAO|nr:PAS domain S-box protein [Poritiphilus flavus]NAS13730.1 PAS domain S-box protein [Poritiphilus flavus]